MACPRNFSGVGPLRPRPSLQVRASITPFYGPSDTPGSLTDSSLTPGSAPRKKVVFDETDNPRLNELLTTMLHKIIFPARLPKGKRKLISNAKNAKKIEADPIIIEVEGYEHRFPILDYHQDTIPPSRKLLRDTIRQMETRADWDNLGRVLSGYNNASRTVSRGDLFIIMRQAGKTGNLYAVLDAFRNAKDTHLRIHHLPVADEFLHHAQLMAIDSGFAERETRDAKTWSLMLHELMQDEGHAKLDATPGRKPLHREPEVVGQLLHLAAAHAVHHGGAADADGKVAELAEVLSHVWPEGRNLANAHDHELAEPLKPTVRIHLMETDDAHLALAISRRISISSYIVHGIELAKKVLAPEAAARLAPIEKVLRADLADLAAKRDEVKAVIGWGVYDKLMAKKE